ncbi:MAG TPA: phosphotransferase [Pyrinomonadaceae bacterium]|jgi:hygromycin-B 7''-O-kinase
MQLKIPSVEFYTHRDFHSDAWQSAAAKICLRHKIAFSELRRAGQGENIIFFVDERFVIKIFVEARNNFTREKASLEFAHGKTSLQTPRILFVGEIEGFPYLVITQLAGVLMREIWGDLEDSEKLPAVEKLAVAARELHSYSVPADFGFKRDWGEFVRRQSIETLERQRRGGVNAQVLAALPEFIEANLKLLPQTIEPVLLHGDIHLGNVLMQERNGRWEAKGLFDFGDSFPGFYEHEFVAPGVLVIQGKRELQRAHFLAYGYNETDLDLDFRARLMLLTILYECSNLRRYAERLRPEAVNYTLEELEQAIWAFY